MITRIKKEFILHNDEIPIDALVVEANIKGFPYILNDGKVYLIQCNNNFSKIKHYDVTNKINMI